MIPSPVLYNTWKTLVVHVAPDEGEQSLEKKAEDSKVDQVVISQIKDGAYQRERVKGRWVPLFEAVLTDG